MSQITDHVLDPYNVPVMDAFNTGVIEAAISEELTALSISEVFGFGDCKDASWGNVFNKHFILDMFSCTNATTLNEQQLECLVGKLFDGLDRQVLCNGNLLAP